MTQDHIGLPPVDPRIIAAADEGCPESRLLMNRREVLGLSAGLFTCAMAPRLASAAPASAPRLLIVLLRGGIDGLNVLPYYGSDNVYSARTRGTLYLDPNQQLTLTGQPNYRLNGVMTNVQQIFNAGKAKFVLPIAPPLRTRSHFDCSYNLENGYPGSMRCDSGWLNRLFGILSETQSSRLYAKPMSIGNIPVILSGASPVMSWTQGAFNTNFFSAAGGAAKASLEAAYAGVDGLSDMLADGLTINSQLNSAEDNKLTTDTLQRNFIAAARLFNSDQFPRIAVLTVDNFDTHIDEANNTDRTLRNFDAAIGKFRAAISDEAWSNTLVVCVSEFGRTVSDNGKGGCDHGIGTVAMLLGGVIKSRAIVGRWPRLEKASLESNMDVPATYDTRDLFRTVLAEHLGVADSRTSSLVRTTVFPDLDTSLIRGTIPLSGLLA